MRREIFRSIHTHRRGLEVRLFRGVDVRNVRLRIAVDERKPRALNLHHQSMSFLECVKDILQLIVDRCRLSGHEWLGVRVAVAPTSTKYVALHKLLITGKL